MYLPLLALLLSISTWLVGQVAPQLSAKFAVESVGITNYSLVSSEHLQQIQQEITKHDYWGKAEDEIAERARYELQKDGYFKADVSTSDLRVLSETPGQRTVAVILQINEGQQYRLGRITFVHNTVFPLSQLRQVFAIKDGDVFDAEKIRLGIDELRKLYASQGYINFVPVPITKANDQAGTVGLVMDIDEGKQFKVESLIVNGKEWSDEEAEKLMAIWRPYAGGIYRPELIEQVQAAILAMFPGLDSAHDLVEIKQHADRHTVEIHIVLPANR